MIEQPLTLPVLLTKHHETDGFDCGKAPLNEFLIKYALHNQASGGARTYVLTRGNRVVLQPGTGGDCARGCAGTLDEGARALPLSLPTFFELL